MSSIMSKMTVSGSCLNENYGIEDAHDYVDETPEDEYEEEEEDYEDDCDCDCEDCCGCRD